MHSRRSLNVVFGLLIGVTACGRLQSRPSTADSIRADSVARARQDSINRAQPGYIVDSILPVEEELRRFREAIGGSAVVAFDGGSSSREELVRRIVRDVAQGDTSDLRALTITPREFADLIYPSSPNTKPPYRQSPGLTWMQISNPSGSGVRRLVGRRAGVLFQYVGHSCKPEPERQGPNAIWIDCTVRLVGTQQDTTIQRWFGSIIERGGRFKVVSFSNQF